MDFSILSFIAIINIFLLWFLQELIFGIALIIIIQYILVLQYPSSIAIYTFSFSSNTSSLELRHLQLTLRIIIVNCFFLFIMLLLWCTKALNWFLRFLRYQWKRHTLHVTMWNWICILTVRVDVCRSYIMKNGFFKEFFILNV